MNNKDKNIGSKIFVVLASIVTVILLVTYLYNEFKTEIKTNNKMEQVVVSDTGEASSINFSVPSNKKILKDTMSLIDKYEKIKRDSINASKIKDIGLNSAVTKNLMGVSIDEKSIEGDTQNSRLLTMPDFSKKQKPMQVKTPTQKVEKPIRKRVVRKRKKAKSNIVVKSIEKDLKKEDNIVDNSKKNREEELEKLRAYEKKMQKQYEKTDLIINEFNKPVVEIQKNTKIFATINGDQNPGDKERVKLRLTKPATINNIEYKKNTFIFGKVKFSENRIMINVDYIKGNYVGLIVYDINDGSPGLYTRENLAEKAKKQAYDDAVNRTTGQVGQVLKAAKDLIKKKNKKVTIELLNNTPIILKAAK